MYQQTRPSPRRGFTLIEVVTVMAIIAVLLAIIIPAISSVRANARDKTRMADIGQLTLALRLYVQKNGSSINCARGLKIDGNTSVVSMDGNSNAIINGTGECADGQKILDFLNSYFNGQIPHDPLGPGDDDHFYYFDAAHTCSAVNGIPLLYAANLEKVPSNVGTPNGVCTDQSGNDGGYAKTSPFPGGTISPSKPYVARLNFVN